MNAIKNPMAAPIDCFKLVGIESTINFLSPKIEIRRNIIPETNTIASASDGV